MPSKNSKVKIFSFSNVLLAIGITFILLLIFVPSFKSSVIRGIMKIGFFQPSVKPVHEPTALSENKTAHFLFRDKSGNTFSFTSLKGKVIFINVWATWCSPCKAELPSIDALNRKLSGDTSIAILTLDADGRPKTASMFLKNRGLHLPVYAVVGDIPPFLSPHAIPYTIVIDKNGFIVYKHVGASDYDSDKFITFIKKLADGKPS